MSAKIVKEGYMTKRAIVSGRNWKKRYFILRQDGRFSYSESHGSPEKNHIDLTGSSRAEVFEELATAGGIYVSGPTHDELFLKAPSTKAAKVWIKKINEVARKIEDTEKARRQNDLEAYAATNKSKFLGRKSLTKLGASTRKFGSTRDQGSGKGPGKGSGKGSGAGSGRGLAQTATKQCYEVKIGDKPQDYIIDPKTLIYYKSKEDFLQGEDYVGKATLELLV